LEERIDNRGKTLKRLFDQGLASLRVSKYAGRDFSSAQRPEGSLQISAKAFMANVKLSDQVIRADQAKTHQLTEQMVADSAFTGADISSYNHTHEVASLGQLQDDW
jgi:hypothetical protein